MKSSRVITILCLLPGLAAAQATGGRRSGIGPEMIPSGTGNPVAESISDEEFLKLRAASSLPVLDAKPLPPAENSYSLLSMSSFLESGGETAILPKGSILFKSPALVAKCPAKPGPRLVGWLGFLTANRSWIRCLEVTPEQIRGESPVAPAALEIHRRSDVVVIATFRGNPVTVLAPKPPPSPSP